MDFSRVLQRLSKICRSEGIEQRDTVLLAFAGLLAYNRFIAFAGATAGRTLLLVWRKKQMLPIPPRSIALLAAITILFLCLSPSVRAADKDPFAESSMRLSVIVGNGYAFSESYLIIGVGFGYYIAKGLELGLDIENWSGSSPHIVKISPEVRYVLPTTGILRPYVGAFYRRTLIENYDDLNSAGGRAGIYLLSGQGSYFGAGAVYEKYFSCNQAVYHSCSDTYPEITFAIAF